MDIMTLKLTCGLSLVPRIKSLLKTLGGANLRREAERQSRGAGQRGALPRGGRGRPHSSLKEPFCNSQEGRKPGYDWEPGGFLVA